MSKNIMSVDLEDHFCDLPSSSWENFESRVVSNTKILLDLFEKYDTHATFFTLGYIAEKHPELIEEITLKGHEIASHGYSHLDIRKITKKEFEDDLKKSLDILYKTSKEKTYGFRAPWFSITKNNFWVFDVLKKYLKYDSSIYPVQFHYGFGNAIRHPYEISLHNPLTSEYGSKFFEVPMCTLKNPILGNLPVAGGIYLRVLPIQFIKNGIKNLNKDGFSATCYIHPQDLDYNRPRLNGLSWHNFIGLKNAKQKFESLLKNFRFYSVRDVIEFNL